MSVEVILHPARATKKELECFLRDRGYVPVEHLWNWPKGSLNFHWYEIDQFKSYDGVEATIYKPSKDKQEELGESAWALHTRTRSSCSPDDRHQQNETIRAARKRFGGDFYNDWHGKNKYTPIEPDGREAIGRGLYLLLMHVRLNISFVMASLPDGHKTVVPPKTKKQKLIVDYLETSHPTRVLYNALVPFAVASLEHFFGQSFRILLKYDQEARKKIQKLTTKKIEFSELLEVQAGTKSIEDIIANWYSFQSVAAIHTAFSEWFSIDFWKIIRQNKRVGGDIIFLEKKLTEMIEFRHDIVHRYDIDRGLDKSQIDALLRTCHTLIDSFVEHIEKSRKIIVRPPYEMDGEDDSSEKATPDGVFPPIVPESKHG